MRLFTKSVASLVVSVVVTGAAFDWSQPRQRLLQWDYPAYQAADAPTLWFNVYSTTNLALPLSQWPLWTNVAVTNLAAPVTASNTFTLAFMQIPQLQFFVMRASNSFYGAEDGFSNVTNTPGVPLTPERVTPR